MYTCPLRAVGPADMKMNLKQGLALPVREAGDAIEAMLRGSAQLDDVREEIEVRRSAGAEPASLGYASAFYWVAHCFETVARAGAEAARGRRFTRRRRDAALGLLRNANDYCAIALAALCDPTYRTDPYDGREYLPVSFDSAPGSTWSIRALLRAAQQLDIDVQAELDYRQQISAMSPAPQTGERMVRRLQAELARGRANLRTAEHAAYPLLNGSALDRQTQVQIERYLRSALDRFLWIGQAAAVPWLLEQPPAPLSPAHPELKTYSPRTNEVAAWWRRRSPAPWLILPLILGIAGIWHDPSPGVHGPARLGGPAIIARHHALYLVNPDDTWMTKLSPSGHVLARWTGSKAWATLRALHTDPVTP